MIRIKLSIIMSYNYKAKDVCIFADLIRTCHSEAKTFALTELSSTFGYSALLRKQYLKANAAAQQFCRLCHGLAHYVCKSGALEDARENLERHSAREFTSFLNATVESLSECTEQYKVLVRELNNFLETSSLVDVPLLGEVGPAQAASVAGLLGGALGASAVSVLGQPEPESNAALALGLGGGIVCFGLAYFACKPDPRGRLQNDEIFESSERLMAKTKEIENTEECLQISGLGEEIRLPDDLFKLKGFLSSFKDSLEPCLLSL